VKRPIMRHPPCAIECRCDGSAIYAVIGNPDEAIRGESGVIGFGDTLPDALRALALEIEKEVEDHLNEIVVCQSEADAVIALDDSTTFRVRAKVELLDMPAFDRQPDEAKDMIRTMPDGAIKLLFSFMRGLAVHAVTSASVAKKETSDGDDARSGDRSPEARHVEINDRGSGR